VADDAMNAEEKATQLAILDKQIAALEAMLENERIALERQLCAAKAAELSNINELDMAREELAVQHERLSELELDQAQALLAMEEELDADDKMFVTEAMQLLKMEHEGTAYDVTQFDVLEAVDVGELKALVIDYKAPNVKDQVGVITLVSVNHYFPFLCCQSLLSVSLLSNPHSRFIPFVVPILTLQVIQQIDVLRKARKERKISELKTRQADEAEEAQLYQHKLEGDLKREQIISQITKQVGSIARAIYVNQYAHSHTYRLHQ
jgi:hypothetical protein